MPNTTNPWPVDRSTQERAAAPSSYDGVVFLAGAAAPTGHDALAKLSLAASLARLLDVELFVPCAEAAARPSWRGLASPYIVPCETLGAARAAELGVANWRDLYGGVVGQAFMATKAISHALVEPGARKPPGWSTWFTERVRQAVLDGYSVFTRADARCAARRLLAEGALRVKDVTASGGLGQSVIHDMDSFEQALAELRDDDALAAGLVLERNLQEVRTLSVGEVRVGAHRLAYHGSQRLTTDHRGRQVYGGSTLHIVRGGLDALLRPDMESALRIGVQQALIYHRAAMSCLGGVFASRSNYDVAQGVDDAGNWRSGVLEQSWRIGGASGAEIAALHAFEEDPALQWVDASTHEAYVDGEVALPPGAQLHFDGDDPAVGRLVKYSIVDACGDV